MKKIMNRRLLQQIAISAFACMFAISAAPVLAQDSAVQDVPAAQDLPSATDIIEMNIDSMGGREALESVTSMASRSTMVIPGPGGDMEARIEIKQSGNKFLMVMELPGMGQMKQGSNGEVYWADNPMMGAKIIIAGPELEAMKQRFSQSFPQLTWGEFDGTIEVTGREAVDDIECYTVDFTPTDGMATTRYFNAANGQVVKEAVTQNTPLGKMTMETYPSDYREVNGIILPFKNVTSTPQGEMQMSFDEYQINQEIEAAVFALPDNIRKLVDDAAGEVEKTGGDGE